MKLTPRLLAGWLALAGVPVASGTPPFVWTGVGYGWQTQVTPPNDGTANLSFGSTIYNTVTLPANLSVNSLTFSAKNSFTFTPTATATPLPLTLTLGSGGMSASGITGVGVTLSPNITVSVPAAQTWDTGTNGSFIFGGKLTGSGNLNLAGTGGFGFNNPTASPTDFTGSITVGPSISNIAIWSSTALGTGPITFTGAGWMVVHNVFYQNNTLTDSGPPTITNNITLNSSFRIRSWDAPATFSGSFTLANNSTFRVDPVHPALPGFDNGGSLGKPGPLISNPLIISGNVVESGGSHSLTMNGQGQGLLILSGTNSYTGGTISTGSLIFANNNAIPATGTIQAGNLNFNNSSGYVGTAVTTSGYFQTFLSKINPASSGAVGIDTLPGSSTVTLSDNINLTGFTTTAQNGIRLSTATSAILTGTITPQGNNYNFGNGGGKLFVQSNLGNVGAATSQLINRSGAIPGTSLPLSLYLQGANTYTGGTSSEWAGVTVFDGANSVPATGSLTAQGDATMIGTSYLGYSNNVTGLTPANFLAKFNKTGTWGIIGFDSSNPASPVAVSNLDLTGFNNGVFVGTSSAAILSGTITPTSVTNGSNAANTLRLTAVNGGTLTVTSNLADIVPSTTPLSLVIGAPTYIPAFSAGTVVLAPAVGNTYTGGTTITAAGDITLALGSNNALGTGPLTVQSQFTNTGLAATAAGLNIPNNISLNSGGGWFELVGSNSFQLSGSISGSDLILLYNATPINATLSGNNSGYNGKFWVYNGTLFLDHNNAAGTAELDLSSANAMAAFTTNAPAPTLYGLYGAGGNLVLPNATNLTFDVTNPNAAFRFGGLISGSGGATTTASLTVTASAPANTDGNVLVLNHANNFTGGTSITGQGAALFMGNSAALGTGSVTVDTTHGGLAVGDGVVFTNSLTFTSGTLAGLGTFAPANLSTVTFGTNQQVLPGLPDVLGIPTGKLTFNTNVTFANGGSYKWSLQDVSRDDGLSLLAISGNLTISANAGGFTLKLATFDASGASGSAAIFDPNLSYSWAIAATTGGTIQQFDVAKFTIDASAFQAGIYSSDRFSLALSSADHNLLLNFAAIPEPSTYAALFGLTALGFAAYRRRKSQGDKVVSTSEPGSCN